MTASKNSPEREFAEAQVAEHAAAIVGYDKAIDGVAFDISEIEKKRANLMALRDRAVALRDQAQQFLDAAKLPPKEVAPAKPRTKRGEIEKAIGDACRVRHSSLSELAAMTGFTADQLRTPLRRMLKSGAIDLVDGAYRPHKAEPDVAFHEDPMVVIRNLSVGQPNATAHAGLKDAAQ